VLDGNTKDQSADDDHGFLLPLLSIFLETKIIAQINNSRHASERWHPVFWIPVPKASLRRLSPE